MRGSSRSCRRPRSRSRPARHPGAGGTAACSCPSPRRRSFVVDDAALAPAPGRRFVVVDARADRIDRGQVVALRRLDAEQHLAAVRVEAVPDVAEPVRRLAGCRGRRRSRSAATARRLRIAPRRAVRPSRPAVSVRRSASCPSAACTPSRLDSLSSVGEIADAVAEAAQEQPARRRPMPGQVGRLVDHGCSPARARARISRERSPRPPGSKSSPWK